MFVFRSDLPNFRDVGLPFFFRPRPGCHSVSHPGWVGVGSAHLPLEKRQRRLLPLRRPGLVIYLLFPFCEKLFICLEGKSMTFRSSQQLPCLHLKPLKGILS